MLLLKILETGGAGGPDSQALQQGRFNVHPSPVIDRHCFSFPGLNAEPEGTPSTATSPHSLSIFLRHG